MAMTIGIIGSGNVGGTLGKRWAKNGHRVVFGSRQPDGEATRRLVAEAGSTAGSGSVAEAAGIADIVLLATPWQATRDALENCGGRLAGKILIDATNPVLPTLDGLSTGNTTSAAEQVAAWAAGAKVVKAFNTVGANIMADPSFASGRVAMFYCGDDAAAKAQVRGLVEELGFEPLDAGELKQARLLEPFALLWITLALKYGYGTGIGFEFLRRA